MFVPMWVLWTLVAVVFGPFLLTLAFIVFIWILDALSRPGAGPAFDPLGDKLFGRRR